MDNIISLKNKEILNCIKLYREGKIEYYDKIIISTFPFVKRLIYTYFGDIIKKDSSIYDDLFDVGITGIMYAIDNYDLSKKINFYNYASYYVKSSIKKYIKQEVNVVSLDELNEKLLRNGKDLISSFNVENNYLKKEILVVLHDVLDTFNPTVKNIILDYFGCNTPRLNLEDISSKYNLGYANASRIIRLTLYKLRLKMNACEYYDRIK